MSTVAVIGSFDGVHLGHRALIAAARARAGRDRLVAVTFDPHPRAAVQQVEIPMLTSCSTRQRLLREAGADHVEVLAFTRALQQLPAEEFIREVIRGRICAEGVMVGANFRFGRRAAGDPDLLRRELAAAGGWAEALELHEDGGEVVSSSRIRALLHAGSVGEAARLLGREHEYEGVVVSGARRGRELGMPTLNVEAAENLVLPADGVYAGRVTGVAAGPWPAAVSVGTNPQFEGTVRTVEAHLIDWDDSDCYGREVAVAFTARLRAQERFESVGELVRQMRLDVDRARELLRNVPEIG